MQGDDDLRPLFGLIASTVERSQLKKQIQSRENPCAAQSSSEDEGRESSPCSEHSSIPTNELECSEESCEWMFTGLWYFPNTCGLLRGVPQNAQALEEPVVKMADEIKSAFLKMLHVTPEYIVVLTNPEWFAFDPDTSEFVVPLRGYIAAKRTSRESWRRFRQRDEFEWTKVSGGIRNYPRFITDRKRVNDDEDFLIVLAEWGRRKFFDVYGHAWAFAGSVTVPPRKTSDCDLLQMTRDAFGSVAALPIDGIRYICVHCDISALMDTDDADEAEIPVRGFLQTTNSRMSKWEAWLQSPWEWRRIRGGLGGNKEFEDAEAAVRSDVSGWTELLREGTLLQIS
jgi:hypothetical protein